MPNRRVWLLLLLILGLRLLTQGWDAGLGGPHPDERQVGFVTEKIHGWFDEPRGEDDPHGFYAYGTLHFQAVRMVASVVGLVAEQRTLTVSGRVVSLLATLLAIFVGWWLTHRAWGERTGRLFLVLAAFVPLDIQQSHFATVEAHHTAWVMLALAGCFWLATRPGRPAAMAVGAAIGASLAVKATSLGLVLPLAAALVLSTRDRRRIEALEAAAVAATSALLAFWFCQPWAFEAGRPPMLALTALTVVVLIIRWAIRSEGTVRTILLLGAGAMAAVSGLVLAGVFGDALALRFNPDYLRGVGEQIAMVMGDADLAYVRVYHGTLPILYPLRELVLWGLGPALVLAAAIASGWGVWALLGRWRRWLEDRWSGAAALLTIVLAWLVPMSVRLGTLQVKYLRYWEPLVVPAVMVAAWGLMRLPRSWRRPAVVVTVAGTALWGMSYLWGFTAPHPHRTAQDWLALMVGSGDVVAFEHWDETLRVAARDQVMLPSYDLPDDDAKVERWCTRLAGADWVVLTSNRVRRTVLANPHRFPRTARLYRLLLAGEAGFEPLSIADRGPRLFGFSRRVQRADESFVNYDFPRVVILRRVEEVDPAELAARTERPLPYLEELDADGLERRFVDPLPSVPPVPTASSQIVDGLVWLIVFAGLGAGAWLLLLPVVRGWPDAGVGLSLATGWVAGAWVMWLGSEAGMWRVGPETASAILLVLVAAGGVVAGVRRQLLRRLWRQRRRAILMVLSAAAAVGLLFLAVRAFNPAIFWGEKPMDFSFLNAFVDARAWPPGEPWMAGMPLHYYYFGEVLAAFPILAAGTAPAVGYNLMSATIPALAAGLLASLGLLIAARSRVAAVVLPPLAVLLTGNLAWPWLGDLLRSGRWFDMWWATSRVIPGFAIDEYPLWTTLFADLHGHFIALPVMLTTLLWGWLTVRLDRYWPAAAALCGVSAAVLVATNPWDVFVLAAALGVGTISASGRPVSGLLRLAVAGGISVAAALPFVFELVAGIGAAAGGRLFHLTHADFAPAWAVLRHFGQFLIPLVLAAVLTMGRGWIWVAVVPAAMLGVLAGVLNGSSAAALALALAAVLVGAAVRSKDRLVRMMWSLSALGMVAVAACERFTLIDRMNTIFKIYNGVWVLLAVALVTMVLRGSGGRHRVLLAAWLPLQALAMVNLPLGIAQGIVEPRIVSPRPTLDGQAFLAEEDPQTWFLVRALQGMARPGEAIAEAAKLAYAEYTRIAMHTGQPTVVGWPYHLEQRGQSRTEIEARYADLETLYAGSDPIARRAVLDSYRVVWVVSADIELKTYGVRNDDPLAGVPGVVKIASRDEAIVYRVMPIADAVPSSSIAVERRLPAGLSRLGSVPIVGGTVVRGVALDDRGAFAVLRDGSLLELDAAGRATRVVGETPCSLVSVARRDGIAWAGCSDGRVWRIDGDPWRPLGAVSGPARLAAGDDLWAWNEQGMWRHEGGPHWRKVSDHPVVAAAARGGTVAATDGAAVWLSRAFTDGRRLASTLPGTRWLAWQGPVLWAVTGGRALRSGGALLPWRPSFDGLEDVAALAGSDDRLWLVLDDGTIAQAGREPCAPPWLTAGGESGLSQPRGIAASERGWFVVADTQHHRIRWYTQNGTCLDTFGAEGQLPGEFREPSGVALAEDGSVAVADTWNGRVQVLRADGTLQMVGDGMYGPRGVLWTPDGGLLVSDTGNMKLLRYRPPRWQREELHTFDGPVVGLSWADGAVAAAVPASGKVVIIETNDWMTLREIVVPGWSSGEQQEGYLAQTGAGSLLAGAPDPGELWLLDPTGITGPRLVADDLAGITGMALLPDGQLVVSRTWDNRLQRIEVVE